MKMKSNTRPASLFLSLSLLAASTAVSSHAKLDQETSESGSSYRGAMLITHGCDGSPTVYVSIRIPKEVKRVKPMAKAGWQLKTIMEKLDEPYELHGSTITEEIREITWSGGTLQDEFFDEFVFRGTLPEQEQTLYFLTVQQCENGEFQRWIDVPETGKSIDDYEKPAPLLKIMPKQHAH